MAAVLIPINNFSLYNPQFVNWLSIPILSYLQFGVSVILTSFFPGYMLLRLFGATRKMPALAVLVFSVILSLFLTASSFLLFVISLRASLFVFEIILLLGDGFLAVCQLSKTLAESRKKATKIRFFYASEVSGNCIYESILLVLTALLTYSFAFSLLHYNSPLPFNDEWQHYGTAIRLLTFARNNSIAEFFNSPSVGDFWPCSFIASTNLLSGFPSLNAYDLLHYLVILPLLGVYLSYRAWFSKVSPKLPVIATIFTMFGGFGGLYLLFTSRNVILNFSNLSSLFKAILFAGAKTYDIIQLVVFYLAPYISPAQIWGLTSFLLLVYLVQPKIDIGRSRWFLIGITVAYGYLGHYAPEIFIFLIIFLFLSLFLRGYSASFIRKTGISAFLGLTIVLASDLLLPVRLYTNDSSYLYCLIISFMIVLVPYIKRCVVFTATRLREISESRKIPMRYSAAKFLRPLVLFSILYVFGLSLLIWINVLPSFGIDKTASGSVDFIPWYLYPIRLGITGLIFLFVLLGIVVSRVYRDKITSSFMLCFIVLILSFIVGKSFHIFPIYMESRLTTFIWFALSPIAAYALVRLTTNLKNIRKKTVAVVLITPILIIGFLSPLYYVEYLSIYNETYVWFPYNVQVSQQEFSGLQFLYQHAGSNTTVLTVTFESRFLIASFGGIPLEHVYGGDPYARDYSQVFFEPQDVETALNLLANSKVNYVYLASRDRIAIDTLYPDFNDGFLLTFLLQYLPIAFQNSAVTIYKVPSFYAPNLGQSNIALLNVPASKLESNLSSGWIWGPTYGDVKQFNATLQNGSLDISQTSGQDGDTWVSYVQKVNMTTNDYGLFGFTYNVFDPSTTWLTVGLLSNNDQWITYFNHLNGTNPSEVTATLPPNLNISEIRLFIETQPQTLNGTLSKVSISDMFFETRENSNYEFDALGLSQAVSDYELSTYDSNTLENYSTILLANAPSSWLDLMNWVERGGHLVFTDFDGDSSFREFLSINTSNETILVNGLISGNVSFTLPIFFTKKITSTDGTVWSTSYFTSSQGDVSPMILNKKMGSGELTYVDLEPLTSLLIDANDSVKSDVFSKLWIIVLLSINAPATPINTTLGSWPEWAVGKISFQGKGIFNTTDISITNPNIIDQFDFIGSNNSFAISNVTFEEFEVTGNSFSFNTSNATLDGSQVKEGGFIQLESSNLSITLVPGDELSVKFSNENTTMILTEGHVNIGSLYPITFNIQLPLSLTVNGSTCIDEAYLYKQLYIPLSELNSVTVNGNSSFKISSVGNGIIIFDSYRFSGHLSLGGTAGTPEWSEFTFVPETLFSIQNLVLIILCILIVLFLIRLKRNYINQ
jgi:hypothetical protein